MQNPSVSNANTGAVLDMKAERKPTQRSANDADARFEKHLERKENADAKADARADAKAEAKAKAETNAQNRADAQANAKAEARQQERAAAKADARAEAQAKQQQQKTAAQMEPAQSDIEQHAAQDTAGSALASIAEPESTEALVASQDATPASALEADAAQLDITLDATTETIAPLETDVTLALSDEAIALPKQTSEQAPEQLLEQTPAQLAEQQPLQSVDITPPADKLAAHIITEQTAAAAAPTNIAAPQAQTQVQASLEQKATLNGLEGRSLVGEVLGQALKLEQASVSQKALAANGGLAGQPDTAFGTEIRNQLEQAFGKAKGDGTPSAPLPAGLNMLDKTGATMTLETPAAPLDQEAIAEELMQLGQEGAAQSAKAADKPDINQLKAMAGAALSAATTQASAKKDVPLKTLGASVGSEIAGLDKLASTQNLTSSAAKPELANLPSRAAQAVPVQNVGMHIARKAMEGQNRFEIRIDPPELGRIEVKLDIGDDGKMRAHLTVEKAETLDLLQRDQRALEKAMQQGGMKGFEDLSFSLKDQGNGNAGQNSNQSGQQQAQSNDGGFGGKGGNASAETITNIETIAMSRAQARAALGGVDLNV